MNSVDLEKQLIAADFHAVLQFADGASLASLVKDLEQSTVWRAASTGPPDQPVINSQRIAEVIYEKQYPSLFATIRFQIADTVKRFKPDLLEGALSLHSLQFVKYVTGGVYRMHRDIPPEDITGCRLVSLVAYLNDDFVGGRTVLAEPNWSRKPLAGEMLVFSPKRLHASQPVVEGVKYALVAWIGIS